MKQAWRPRVNGTSRKAKSKSPETHKTRIHIRRLEKVMFYTSEIIQQVKVSAAKPVSLCLIHIFRQTQWLILIIWALESQFKLEVHEFKISLGYVAHSSVSKQKIQKIELFFRKKLWFFFILLSYIAPQLQFPLPPLIPALSLYLPLP